MKKLFVNWMFLTFLFPALILAQGNGNVVKEKMNAQKIAFLTEKMQLTPSEAQHFWPVYNEYQLKKKKIAENRRANTQYYLRNQKKLSKKELESIADNYVACMRQEADLLSVYNEKFKNVLPADKVIKLYQAEVLFRSFLLNQIRGSNKKTGNTEEE
jgi:hypothetical protein